MKYVLIALMVVMGTLHINARDRLSIGVDIPITVRRFPMTDDRCNAVTIKSGPIPNRLVKETTNNLLSRSNSIEFSPEVVHLDPSKSFVEQVIAANKVYVVYNDFKLGGNVTIPENCVLKFEGGTLSNGTLIGTNTVIEAERKRIFGPNIKISGKWNTKTVYSSWFTNEVNCLKHLFNFTSNETESEIYIDNETYYLSPIENRAALMVPTHTRVSCAGKIVLNTSNYKGAKIIGVKGDCTWMGGTIEGDINTNTVDDPQYGHGFELEGACNNIINVTITNCNGDGVYISEGSRNVTIDKVNIKCCSRNGISVIGDNNIMISNCIISDIRKTDPKACVDIEPNNEGVKNRNISIINLTCSNANYGVSVAGNTKNSANINVTNLYADETVDHVCSCYSTSSFNVCFNNVLGKNFIITYCTGPISINNSTITNIVVGTNVTDKHLMVKDCNITIKPEKWIAPTSVFTDPKWVYTLSGSYESCVLNYEDSSGLSNGLAFMFGAYTSFCNNTILCKNLYFNSNTQTKSTTVSNNKIYATYIGFMQSDSYITLENNYIEFSGESVYPISMCSMTKNLVSRLMYNVININNMVNRLTLVLDTSNRAIMFIGNTIIDDNNKLMNLGGHNYGWTNSDNVVIRNNVVVSTRDNY